MSKILTSAAIIGSFFLTISASTPQTGKARSKPRPKPIPVEEVEAEPQFVFTFRKPAKFKVPVAVRDAIMWLYNAPWTDKEIFRQEYDVLADEGSSRPLARWVQKALEKVYIISTTYTSEKIATTRRETAYMEDLTDYANGSSGTAANDLEDTIRQMLEHRASAKIGLTAVSKWQPEMRSGALDDPTATVTPLPPKPAHYIQDLIQKQR